MKVDHTDICDRDFAGPCQWGGHTSSGVG